MENCKNISNQKSYINELNSLLLDIKGTHKQIIFNRKNVVRMKSKFKDKRSLNTALSFTACYTKGIYQCNDQINLLQNAMTICKEILKYKPQISPKHLKNNGNILKPIEMTTLNCKTVNHYNKTVVNGIINKKHKYNGSPLAPYKHVLRRGELMQILEQKALELPVYNGKDGKKVPLCGCINVSASYFAQPGDKVAAYVNGLEPLQHISESPSTNSKTTIYSSLLPLTSSTNSNIKPSISYSHSQNHTPPKNNSRQPNSVIAKDDRTNKISSTLTNGFCHTSPHPNTQTKEHRLRKERLKRESAQIASNIIKKHLQSTPSKDKDFKTHTIKDFFNKTSGMNGLSKRVEDDFSQDSIATCKNEAIFDSKRNGLKQEFSIVNNTSSCSTLLDENGEDENEETVWILAQVVRSIPSPPLDPQTKARDGSPPKKAKLSSSPHNFKTTADSILTKGTAASPYTTDVHFYEIEDIDENKERYIVDARNVIPLSLMRVDPSTCPKLLHPIGSLVLARYPQTTCFYRAIIQSLPRSAEQSYEVIFEDPLYPDGYSPPLTVPQYYVVPFRSPRLDSQKPEPPD